MPLFLVTGAGGFLGRYVCEKLVARGDAVRGIARGDYPELTDLGVEMFRGDLADLAAVTEASRGVDGVLHVGGKVGVWGKWFDYFRSNVHGTMNVLAACREQGVERLVFTSSPSVTFDAAAWGACDQRGVGPDAPYPTRWLAHYPHSKALAEDMVLAQDSSEVAGGGRLRTCSLRPHLVWGPRDPHLFARLVDRARSGRLRRVGPGGNRVDTVYVENAADAHLLALDRLAEPSPACAGKAYFLSQGAPVDLWRWIDELLALAGLPPVRKAVSARAAYAAGAALESLYWASRRFDDEPAMTRFVARQLATDHWFDPAPAERDLGYRPAVSTEQGMRRLAEWARGAGHAGVGKRNVESS